MDVVGHNLIKDLALHRPSDLYHFFDNIALFISLLDIEEPPPFILFGGMPKLPFFPFEITDEPLSKL